MSLNEVARTFNSKSPSRFTTVWSEGSEGSNPGLIYVTGMAVDGDGSPRCYSPNAAVALDYTANAKDGDRWVGVVCDKQGHPIVQGADDPAPGCYVSPTSLHDSAYEPHDPRRYVNSEQVPYIAFPSSLLQMDGTTAVSRLALGVNLGDYAVLYNRDTPSRPPCFTIFADVGPRNKLGEASIAAAAALGLPTSPKNGGTESRKIVYLIFPGSFQDVTTPWPQSLDELAANAQRRFEAWGGLDHLLELLPDLAPAGRDLEDETAVDLPDPGELSEEEDGEPLCVTNQPSSS